MGPLEDVVPPCAPARTGTRAPACGITGEEARSHNGRASQERAAIHQPVMTPASMRAAPPMSADARSGGPERVFLLDDGGVGDEVARFVRGSSSRDSRTHLLCAFSKALAAPESRASRRWRFLSPLHGPPAVSINDLVHACAALNNVHGEWCRRSCSLRRGTPASPRASTKVRVMVHGFLPIWPGEIGRPRQDSHLRHQLRRPVWSVQPVQPVHSHGPDLGLQSTRSVDVFPVSLIRLPKRIAKRIAQRPMP